MALLLPCDALTDGVELKYRAPTNTSTTAKRIVKVFLSM